MNFIIDKLSSKVLNNINLCIESNVSLAIVGTNGSGKTTLSECIGYSTKYKGTITMNKLPLIPEKVSYIPQFSPLSNLSINDNITEIKESYIAKTGTCFNQSIYNHACKMLIDFGLYPEQMIKSLSGGQIKKLRIVEGIITNPYLFILDEATSAIDIESRIIIFDKITQFKKYNTCCFIIVTHYPEEVFELCDIVCLLEKGRGISKPMEVGIFNHCNNSKEFFKLIQKQAVF